MLPGAHADISIGIQATKAGSNTDVPGQLYNLCFNAFNNYLFMFIQVRQYAHLHQHRTLQVTIVVAEPVKSKLFRGVGSGSITLEPKLPFNKYQYFTDLKSVGGCQDE